MVPKSHPWRDWLPPLTTRPVRLGQLPLSYRPLLEALEDRTLFSYNVDLTGTTLTIVEGTAGDNSNLTMSLAAGIFNFTDTTLTFNPATGNNGGNVMYSNGNKT